MEREQYEKVADFLHDIGWRSSGDAQWSQLRDKLPELKALLSTTDARDGARMDFLESLAVADIDEKAITRLVIFNLWRGTTYDDLRTAIDNAQATEGK